MKKKKPGDKQNLFGGGGEQNDHEFGRRGDGRSGREELYQGGT